MSIAPIASANLIQSAVQHFSRSTRVAHVSTALNSEVTAGPEEERRRASGEHAEGAAYCIPRLWLTDIFRTGIPTRRYEKYVSYLSLTRMSISGQVSGISGKAGKIP